VKTAALLVSAPFAAPQYPSLGLSLLQAGLCRRSLRADIRYCHLEYVEAVGVALYEMLADATYYDALVGEFVFAAAAHDRAADEGWAEYAEFLRGHFPEAFFESRLLGVRIARLGAAAFINRMVRAVAWERYAVIGFTTSFQQNMASLALARRVKEEHPGALIVFGGANCEADMGVELHRRYPFIDIVCSGEADETFPELVHRVIDGRPCNDLPGFIFRSGGRTVVPRALTPPAVNMDALPDPDFTDFYEQQRAVPSVHRRYPPVPLFETARGCWWGAKHHCTFCGLNGQSMAFRSKSPSHAYEQITALAQRYGRDVVVVDNILDMKYFDELLPRLAEPRERLVIHWETKVNLRAAHLTLMARAGLRKIQPGIETLSTEILRLMRKGSTVLQNVQTLKLAAEHGIYVEWNFLYGFPGETPEQYEVMAEVVPKLFHLQPPGTWLRVRPDRFSPYFASPEAYGVTVDPSPAYRHVYPFGSESLSRLAYHFRMTSGPLAAADRYTADVARLVSRWQRGGAHRLFVEHTACGCFVIDERGGVGGNPLELGSAEADVVDATAEICSVSEVEQRLGPVHGRGAIHQAISRLEDKGLVLREGTRVLALPLRQPGFQAAPSWDQIRALVATADG
jgi:ribosomal peptide maturation radical SAM protein 1